MPAFGSRSPSPDAQATPTAAPKSQTHADTRRDTIEVISVIFYHLRVDSQAALRDAPRRKTAFSKDARARPTSTASAARLATAVMRSIAAPADSTS